MALSRRHLMAAIAASFAAPAMAEGEGRPIIAAGEGRAISARVRLPDGQWKRFSCSYPVGLPLAPDAALAHVRERNGVGAADVADLTIG
jgi:hypothetical protein